MREIKFRIWCKQVEGMYKVEKIGFDNDELRYVEDEDGELYFTDKNDSVLMQYTGLKDKNGREIYEGDILHVEHPTNEMMSGIFEVSVSEKTMNYIAGNFNLGTGVYKFGEIIGNIYENPELLGE